MPKACVEVFTDRLTDIMNAIEKEHKLCYIMGDLNIDFLKSDHHKSTGALFDVLHIVFPLITKPTHVTEKTATLIYHIWTNNFDCRIWSWSPMPCEKHGPRDSVDKNRGRRPRFLSLLRSEGHVFHTAWETMIKSYYSTLTDWFFPSFVHRNVNFNALKWTMYG